MTAVFDTKDPNARGRSPRPRDAATLVLVRRGEGGASVLMGQRHERHAFMPNKYVFPGGGIDREDLAIRPLTPLRADVERRLRVECKRARVEALALAAIRETFEETGVLVGARSDAPLDPVAGHWAHFFARGVAPSLEGLDFIARAITPPQRPRRFDARFFMADASAIAADVEPGPISGELKDVRWVPLGEARTLDLPTITRRVISEIEERVREPGAARPVPFFRFRHGKPSQMEL